MNVSVFKRAFVYKAVIVAYACNYRTIGYGYKLVGHRFLNSLGIEIKFRRIVPNIVAPEYAVTGNHLDLIGIKRINHKTAAPVNGVTVHPRDSAIGHGHFFVNAFPCLAAVCGAEKLVAEGSVRLRYPAVFRHRHHSLRIGGVDNHISETRIDRLNGFYRAVGYVKPLDATVAAVTVRSLCCAVGNKDISLSVKSHSLRVQVGGKTRNSVPARAAVIADPNIVLSVFGNSRVYFCALRTVGGIGVDNDGANAVSVGGVYFRGVGQGLKRIPCFAAVGAFYKPTRSSADINNVVVNGVYGDTFTVLSAHAVAMSLYFIGDVHRFVGFAVIVRNHNTGFSVTEIRRTR